MFKVKDFSNWKVYDGAAEGSGRSEKIWLISEDETIGLFKFPKIDPAAEKETTEHISEHLAHQIANKIGVKTAVVDLGFYEGRIGSMSYLVNETPLDILIEGVSFIFALLPNYNVNTLQDEASNEYYCIEHIFQSTETFVSKDVWIEMMLFDFLIGNTDRHQSNWAIILKVTDDFIASPFYDNGSSLCCYVNEAKVKQMLGPDPGPFAALTDSKSRSLIRIDGSQKKQPRHREVVQFLMENYPSAYEIGKRFVDSFNFDTIDQLMDQYPEQLLEKTKNDLIRKFLKRKIEILRQMLEEYNENEK